jgi:hypothetical protein
MRSFIKMTREDFDRVLAAFKWKRQIMAVHMHHTWQPNHDQWQGLKSMKGMYLYHTSNNGWSDIAQHVTIDPDGFIWSGRDWNKSPASSNGFNGTGARGPFMFETVGNFDKEHDTLRGEQLKSVLHVISQIQINRRLETESLKFHRQLGSQKTCPGSGIDYDWMLDQVDDYKKLLREGPVAPAVVSSANTEGVFSRLKKRLWWG